VDILNLDLVVCTELLNLQFFCAKRCILELERYVLSLFYGCDGANQKPNVRILCAKYVGYGCGFVVRSKLVPAVIAIVIQLSYLTSISANADGPRDAA